MRAVNLLPEDARSRGLSIKPRPAHGIALVLLALAVMALLYGQARNQAQHAESEAIQVRTETAAVERAAVADTAAAAAVPAFEKYIGGVAKVVTSRYGWAPLFHQLAVTVPHGVEFTNLTVSLISPTPSALGAAAASPSMLNAPQGATMNLKGCSFTQPQVATMMRSLREVADVSEVSLVSSVKNTNSKTGGSSASSGSGGCPPSGTNFEVVVTVAAPKPWAGAPITRAVTAAELAAAAKKKGGKR